MDFNFTDEQQLLADTVRRFVRQHYAFETRREIRESPDGWSREVWGNLAELGLTALNVAEEYGGMNAGPIETMLVMNALGEGLLLEPYLAAAVIAPALIQGLQDEQAAAELLPAIAAGERLVILAHQEPGTRGEFEHVATRAEKHGGDYILNGHKNVIVHGGSAEELLVTARTSGAARDAAGVSVFRVDPAADGVTVRSYGTIDGLRAAEVELEGVRLPAARRIGAEGEAAAAIETTTFIALSALCAEAVGIMKAMNSATVEYCRNRKQFGQSISKFQVLQHRMVDMFIHAEQAQSMSYLAAVKCIDPDLNERRRTLSAAKVVIGQAARFVAQQAVQLHGGMGMTDEMIVSHYFKRLTAIDLTLGDADFHLQRFIAAA